MLEIYTIYGGGMWKTALDAVVTLVGQNTFHTLMRIASTFGVLAVLFTFIKQRNPMVFVQWLAVFMILTSILLVPKRSVQVIDLSDPAAVWKTDNVPVGLAAIASLTTSIGYKMSSVYDMLMARPDSITYSKTGMLFGSTDMRIARSAKMVRELDTQNGSESPSTGIRLAARLS